jgi:hypothetical protein
VKGRLPLNAFSSVETLILASFARRWRDAQAEALADAVASTRWGGNRQGSHAAYSLEAFTLLHARFSGTPEAKRTTYWFN